METAFTRRGQLVRQKVVTMARAGLNNQHSTQVKDPLGISCFMGRGRGITMQDGGACFRYSILVPPGLMPVMFSKDSGEIDIHNHRRTNTTRHWCLGGAGVLMLKHADNRGEQGLPLPAIVRNRG